MSVTVFATLSRVRGAKSPARCLAPIFMKNESWQPRRILLLKNEVVIPLKSDDIIIFEA